MDNKKGGDGFQGICCFAQVNGYLIVAQAQTSGTAAGGSWYREVEAEVEAQVSGDEGRSKAGVNEAVAVELELRGDTGSENNEEFRNETSGSNKLTQEQKSQEFGISSFCHRYHDEERKKTTTKKQQSGSEWRDQHLK